MFRIRQELHFHHLEVTKHVVNVSSDFELDQSYLTARLLKWRRTTDVPLIAIALGSLPILFLELASDRLSRMDRILISSINVLVFVSFAVDYLVELFLAGSRRTYLRKEWTSLLIALSQGVALLHALEVFGAVRILRTLRPITFIWRLLAIGTAESKEVRAKFRDRAISIAVSVAGFVWITSAVAFTLAEDVGDGRRVRSFGDALWWSAATISTVGYGDIYPVTALGRIIAVITMVVGVSTFGVITAKLASLLMRG